MVLLVGTRQRVYVHLCQQQLSGSIYQFLLKSLLLFFYHYVQPDAFEVF